MRYISPLGTGPNLQILIVGVILAFVQPLCMNAQQAWLLWTKHFDSAVSLKYSGNDLRIAAWVSEKDIELLDAANATTLATVHLPTSQAISAIGFCGGELYAAETPVAGERRVVLYQLNWKDSRFDSTKWEFYSYSGYTYGKPSMSPILIGLPGNRMFMFSPTLVGDDHTGESQGGSAWLLLGKDSIKKLSSGGTPKRVSQSGDGKTISIVTYNGGTVWITNGPDAYYYENQVSIISTENGVELASSDYEYRSDRERNTFIPGGWEAMLDIGSSEVQLFRDRLFHVPTRRFHALDTSLPIVFCNLKAPGIMLGGREAQNTLSLVTYNLANNNEEYLYSIPNAKASEIEFYVNDLLHVFYAYHKTARILYKFGYKYNKPTGGIIATRSPDTTTQFGPITLSVFPILGWAAQRMDVALGQQRLTLPLETVVYPRESGTLPLSVTLWDHPTTTPASKRCKIDLPPVNVSHPKGVLKAYLANPDPVVFLATSPLCKRLAVGRKGSSSFDIITPVIEDNQSGSKPIILGQLFTHFIDEDSISWFSFDGSRKTLYSTYLSHGLGTTNTMYPESVGTEEFRFEFERSLYPNNPDHEYPPYGQGKFIYTPRKDLVLFQFSSRTKRKNYESFENALYSIKDTLGKLQVTAIMPPKVEGVYSNDAKPTVIGIRKIHDIDVSLDSVMLIVDSYGLTGRSMKTSDTLFRIYGPKNDALTSAFMVDEKTIHTNIGIYRFSGSWSLNFEYPFKDIIELYPINNFHTIVLRTNTDTVAMIVDTWNGTVIRALGEGFGQPNCAAIDSVHRWLYIGDAWGVVATYDISDALSVRNTGRSEPYSTPVFDISAGTVHLPEGETEININFFNLLGELRSTAVYYASNGAPQSIELPPTNGLYIVSATAHGNQLDIARIMVGYR